ncbi:MAG: cell division protein FtsL [Spongiibacteraceae bacterium]
MTGQQHVLSQQERTGMRKTATTLRFLRPGQVVVTAGLVLLVLVSALALINSTHRSRDLFNELQQEQRREWVLDEDWERLLLEQGTLAAYERVSQTAEGRLDMVTPDPATVRVIQERAKP